ncbi:MAG TPA: hypothetical protein DCL61_04900 [Cyanobacteria bacterium UBA12227]|nr:hypothetical protein [Cyanobacteria bacterium UBA12227]HAX87166.1 hypothetical protein [Cyanobacteria bacterium UBA11370]HBY78907.1 hypothetical protein [Cyanobacteria bacterium UBA11148]
MSPRKLSDTDKKDILKLYREPDETTSTLADRYGVSNSTISRLLKSSLLESEYEALIQQKRLNRTPSSESSPPLKPSNSLLESETESSPLIQTTQPSVEWEDESSMSPSTDPRWRRRRSSVPPKLRTEADPIQTELPLDFRPSQLPMDSEESDEFFEEIDQAKTSDLEELLDDNLMGLDEDLDEDLDDDLDEDLEEDLDDDLDDDLDEDWDDEEVEFRSRRPIKNSPIRSNINVQVLPLSEASLPKICYLVVDRSAELVARPLREFSDLGRIPVEEVQQKTLPIFDNHRVAKRFSNRSQRVIKVPDGQMLQKTCSHLKAKGITRLLIDGQVYSLFPIG